MSASQYIIVKVDAACRDIGVFTGHAHLVETRLKIGTDVHHIMADGEISPHIESAFVFPDTFQAWRWCDRLCQPWHLDEALPRSPFNHWRVRRRDEFSPGEHLFSNVDRHML